MFYLNDEAGETMAQSDKLLPICLVCEQVPPEGIMGGIVINGNFLCTSCEKELLSVAEGDARYKLFQDKLKKIWL